MAVYIAKDYKGTVLDIVIAKSPELANVYWQGKSVPVHHVDIKTNKDLADHITGVIPVLSTKEIKIDSFGLNEKTYRVVV